MSSRYRMRHVAQQGPTDCGMAALASAMSCYGGHYSVSQLWINYGRANEALSIAELKHAASACGFNSEAYFTTSLDALGNDVLPAIVHLRQEEQGGHFVCVDRRIGPYLRVSDPAGELHWKHQSKVEFSGYILHVKSSASTEFVPSGITPRFRLLQMAWDIKRRLAAVFALACISALCGIAASQYVRILVDEVAGNGINSPAGILLTGAVVCLITLVGSTSTYIAARIGFENSVRMERELTARYIKKAAILPPGIFRSFSTGDVVARVGDIGEVRSAVNDLSVSLVLSFATSIGVAGFLLFQSVGVGIIAICGSAILVLMRLVSGRTLLQVRRLEAIESSRYSQLVIEGVEGTSATRLHNWEGFMVPRTILGFDALIAKMRKMFRMEAILESLMQLFGTIMLVFLLALAAIQVARGEYTPGMIASFAVLVPMLTSNALSLAGMQQELQAAEVAVERLYEFIDLDLTEADAHSAEAGHRSGLAPFGELEECLVAVSDLKVLHAGSVLCEIDHLEISTGEVLGIAGDNGSGKTTLCRTIAGLDIGWSGSITVSGRDQRDYSLNELCSKIAYVPDSIPLFSGTLRENICLGNPQDDLSEIIDQVELQEMIGRMPAGLDTPIGPTGVRLSGGECQRVGIARALISHPNLLILDEATRLIDREGRIRVIENLVKGELCSGIILVAHDSELRDQCSRIVNIGSSTDGE